MNFFKSPMGKFLLWAIALTVVGIVIWKQYEKSIYGGMTKSALISTLANRLSAEAKASIIANDTNYASATTDAQRQGVFDWYNNTWAVNGYNVSESWLKQELTKLGIDFVKRPSVLLISSEIGKNVSVK